MILPVVLGLIALVVVVWMAASVSWLLLSLVPWALVGLLTGWVATKITGTRLGAGWTLLAGVVGSWIGGALFSTLLGVRLGGLLNPVNLLASVVGAVIVITFTRLLARPALTGSDRARLGRGY
jgi:uncharacterized membrane protein YeaQ/YmgE (transglycosylase-associated protein family)